MRQEKKGGGGRGGKGGGGKRRRRRMKRRMRQEERWLETIDLVTLSMYPTDKLYLPTARSIFLHSKRRKFLDPISLSLGGFCLLRERKRERGR